MKTKAMLATATLMMVFSCNQIEKQKLPSFLPEVVEFHGYVVSKDSIAEPKVVPVGTPRVVRAGKPKEAPTYTNIHSAGIPKVVVAGVPKVCIPGQDGFSLPKTFAAVDRPFIAGIPKVFIAKELYKEEQNPKNFSSLSKHQGLKSTVIYCLLQDNSGNLWFGTQGDGVTKYDGRNFTHFKETEGLGSNFIRSILEDINGNLWFGTWEAGVTKYDGKSFTRFTEEKGQLCDNTILSMLVDKSGNLWFGTESGVSRYDGKYFTHFTEKEGFSNHKVYSIEEDKSGSLWFGTFGGGVSKYDGKSFTHLTEKEGLSNDSVFSVLEDKSGILWIGTNMGLNRYNGKSFMHFTEKQGLTNNSITTILEDKSGSLWFGTFGGGVSKYDGKSFTHLTEKEGLNNNVVYKIIEDKYGNKWFGTQDGVNKYDPGSFIHFTEKEGLSGNNIWNILEDKGGNLWFGTFKNGVNKYDGKSFTHFTVNEGLVSKNVWGMLEDKNGHLWFGGFEGVSEYDGKSFTHFTEKEGLINNDIKCIFEDKSGNLWFGGEGGVSKYDGKSFTRFTKREGLSTDNVMSILQDKNGHLWFCGYNGGVSRYDGKNFTHFTKKEGLSHNNVRSIMEDKSGNLWFGTLGGGVCKYDGKSFSIFTEKAGLSNNDVTSMLVDKSGNLWFGTGYGLNKLEKDKLSSNINNTLPLWYADDDSAKSQSAMTGSLTKKATNLTKSEHFFKTYTHEEGFSGVGVNSGKSIFEARDGTIWVGANDRLTAFHPDRETPDTIPPNIQLTALTLYNESIAWQNLLAPTINGIVRPQVIDSIIVLGNGVEVHNVHFDSVSKWYSVPQHLILPYNNNYLTFQFVGITLHAPKKVKYQYKLEGLDENWSAVTNRSEATYGNVPHGHYTFKVKAVNGDGYWSQELSYPFTIKPPWWHTWWAYSLYALLFAVGVYAVHLNRSRAFRRQLLQREREKQLAQLRQKSAELQQQTTELKMQALRSQMNPHFIFNCLNAINHFILKNEAETASDYLTKFSRLIRMVLQNSAKKTILLSDELETLRLYIDLEKMRFKRHFDYTIRCDESLDAESIIVPPLLLQPFVENAIWHGLMHKEEKGELTIALSRENDLFCCAVTDNGIGWDKAAAFKSESTSFKRSMGMQITTNRLQMINEKSNGRGFLQFIDLKNGSGEACGTTVIIKIPINFRDDDRINQTI